MKNISVENRIKFAIIEGYSITINNIMAEISSEEKSIIEHPDIGTVLDGGKRFFADECKRMLAEIVTDYYSADNLDKIKEYQLVLRSRLDGEYNYENTPMSDRTTKQISKNWATHSVMRKLDYMVKMCNDGIGK